MPDTPKMTKPTPAGLATLDELAEETIREALGCEPVRPAEMAGIEALPQQVVVMAPDVAAIKQFIVDHL